MATCTDYIHTLMDVIASPGDVLTFLHNTQTKEVAINVIDKGFRFNSHIDYSTDCVSAKDMVTVKYFSITRQAYGNYTIIIQISKSLIEHYSSLLHNKKHHFSEILSVESPVLGAEDDFIYQLAPQFVRGFIHSETGELVENSSFDPYFDPPIFTENLERIQNESK